MNEDKFVRKFCKEPYQISALSHSENHFYDFLGILNILLVKNHKKKFHITGGNKRNVLKVAQTLKIYCNQLNRPYFLDKYQSNIIDKQILDLLIKSSHPCHDLCFAMNEKSITELNGVPLSDGGLGTLFEYPECCVEWFVQATWEDKEIAYDYVKEHGLARTNEEWIVSIENYAGELHEHIPELLQRRKKIYLKNMKKVRQKFPFVEHQACDSCVDNVDSSTEKLNKIYAKFAKEKYPDLYKLIISESKKEAKKYAQLAKEIDDFLTIL
jgi:hypothetical protein